jgi:hypothetical protein
VDPRPGPAGRYRNRLKSIHSHVRFQPTILNMPLKNSIIFNIVATDAKTCSSHG